MAFTVCLKQIFHKIKKRLTLEYLRLIPLCEFVDQLPSEELWALGLYIDVILVNSDSWVELHSVEVREQVYFSSFFAEARSLHRLAGHRSVERRTHDSCFACLSGRRKN